jgi:hypothetical protein
MGGLPVVIPLALALFPGNSVERSRFLLYVLAAALGALGFFVVVLMKGEHQFKSLLAIVADIVIDGHGKPPGSIAITLRESILAQIPPQKMGCSPI